ncbi:CREB/ATF bZIP transcription factor isoform X1 [Periophthalmus magnuspinnatus]|uniref:CREB/ATF bZIP transcription factor isoform X1 n=1 Tax=Periophthalmus magnuspinnatus TaxID=409849 RepID=UPI00145B85BB|nr:CREB/ATF bZIP transcription factor isoform X1 [Periophthalmus magnuspinnatus]
MITRRRGRMLQVSEEQPVEVEVCDSQMSPTETFTGEDLDATTIELDELFREFKWTVDRDPTSPLFDMDLEEFRMYGTEQDSGREVSSASSPERRETDLKMRKSNQSHGLNKNAIAARLNRIKKKEYVSNLERKVTGLSSENSTLKRENSELMKRVEELEDETRYLRAVLANESTLAQLLARLSGVNGMKLSSSLFQAATNDPSDHDYALPQKRVRVEERGAAAGGVCLHVDRDHVSVEFCPKCSESASAALKIFF